jgi:hypothetical protein
MGKREVLSVGEEEVCAYTNQFPVASQQNTANHFFLLWVQPISRSSVLSENSKRKNIASANINTTGGSTSNMDKAVKR